MAQPLTPISIAAPGFFGLNSQDASTSLSTSFALIADNCVIDQYGRIGARKGWTPVNASNVTLGNNAVSALHEFVKSDGTTVQITVGNKNIFTGTSTLTSIYNDATWTANNWKVESFNNKAYFFQRGHAPLVYDGTTCVKLSSTITAMTRSAAVALNAVRRPAVDNGYYYVCTTAGTTAAAEPTWSTTLDGTTTDGTAVWTTKQIPWANEVLSAYGRLWIADTTSDKVSVAFSDTLIGNTYFGGASGNINLHNVFTNGTDSIVALAAFNGFLVILCKNTTIIYQGADTPSTMTLYDVIDGVGCVSRDTVQDIGSDLLFLSNRGVLSIGRLIQEKSAPINDLSKNVRDQLIQSISAMPDKETIKSAFNAKDSFYLLSLPYHDTVYCFDLRFKLEDGSLRATTWSGQTPTAFCTTKNDLMYMGKPGYIGLYNSYADNGATYTLSYFTNHMDGGSQSNLKFLKKMGMVIVGGGNARLRLKWITDYNYQTIGAMSTNSIPAAAEYNVSEYGIAEWNSGNITRLTQQLGGSGSTFQIGVEAIINGGSLSIQQMDIFFKLGRGR